MENSLERYERAVNETASFLQERVNKIQKEVVEYVQRRGKI